VGSRGLRGSARSGSGRSDRQDPPLAATGAALDALTAADAAVDGAAVVAELPVEVELAAVPVPVEAVLPVVPLVPVVDVVGGVARVAVVAPARP
jgi:hypothetical protein